MLHRLLDHLGPGRGAPRGSAGGMCFSPGTDIPHEKRILLYPPMPEWVLLSLSFLNFFNVLGTMLGCCPPLGKLLCPEHWVCLRWLPGRIRTTLTRKLSSPWYRKCESHTANGDRGRLLFWPPRVGVHIHLLSLLGQTGNPQRLSHQAAVSDTSATLPVGITKNV